MELLTRPWSFAGLGLSFNAKGLRYFHRHGHHRCHRGLMRHELQYSSRPPGSLSLSEVAVSRGSAHPLPNKPSIRKKTRNSRIVGIAAPNNNTRVSNTYRQPTDSYDSCCRLSLVVIQFTAPRAFPTPHLLLVYVVRKGCTPQTDHLQIFYSHSS